METDFDTIIALFVVFCFLGAVARFLWWSNFEQDDFDRVESKYSPIPPHLQDREPCPKHDTSHTWGSKDNILTVEERYPDGSGSITQFPDGFEGYLYGKPVYSKNDWQCGYCGSRNSRNNYFCSQCGAQHDA